MRIWTLKEILHTTMLGHERWVSDEECREALQEKILEILEQDKEIKRLKEIIKCKDVLLVAYRLGTRKGVEKALDRLQALEEECVTPETAIKKEIPGAEG